MNNRAFNRGVTVAFSIKTAGAAVARGAKTVGNSTASAARSTKDVTSSFWAGLKAGFKSDAPAVPSPEKPRVVVTEPQSIIVSRI